MKYFLIVDDNIEYWIEVDESGYALRQIVIDNVDIQISCKVDCLAEISIILEEFHNFIKTLSKEMFEEKWNSIILHYQESWNKQKDIYYCGKEITAKVKYFYPKGIILQIDNDTQGICKYDECNKYFANLSLYPGYIIKGKVTDYDETNMWLVISDFFD